MNRYFNRDKFFVASVANILGSLVMWCKQSNSCLSINVLDIHVVLDTHPTFILIWHSHPGGSINFLNSCIVNNEDGG